MKVLGNLEIEGEVSGAFKEYADFPKDPQVGTWARINRMIMVCSEMDDGTPLWLPMTPERDTFIHRQDTPSADWIVPHNLGIKEVIIQCYDDTGKVAVPSNITPIDERSCLVQFPQDISGKAIAMVGYTDGQAIATGANGAMYSGRGAPLFERLSVGVTSQVILLALGKDGMIYIAGRNYNHSQGQGDGAPESCGGFKIAQLPYYRSRVKDFGHEWGQPWVLFENGELWGWGYNGGYFLGLDHTTIQKIPVQLATGVDAVIQSEYSGYIWNNDNRRRIYKMKDGSYKIVGRADKLWGDGSGTHSRTPQDLRLPEGVTFADIEEVRIVGNFERGCVYIQTTDKRHFMMGNNAYGQLGSGDARSNTTLDWKWLTQFNGLSIENITGSDGWSTSSGADRSCRYMHFTNGEVYYAGEGYSGYYMTGRELEDLPMDATLALTWTLIQENVEEIHCTHAPCSMIMKQNGKWKQFGYSYEYQIDDSRSRNIMTPIDVPCGGDAMLLTKLSSYNYSYNQPVMLLDGNRIHMRSLCNYGVAFDGNNGRTLQQWEHRDFTLDKSPIKQAFTRSHHESLHNTFLLLEDGSLYAVGYGGYNILSGSHGHQNRSTVAVWRRLN